MSIISTKLLESLVSAVEETFEEMAFLEVSEAKASLSKINPDKYMTASLLVLEPWPGEIALTMPRNFIGQLAVDLFGMGKEDLDESSLFDLLAEILNTISGKFMSRLVSRDDTFALGLPQKEDNSIALQSERIRLPFEADDHLLYVAITGEPLVQGG